MIRFKETPNGGYEKEYVKDGLRYIERKRIEYDEDDEDYCYESLTKMRVSNVVNYADIFEQCEIREDNEYRTPWDECDGYSHEFVHICDLRPEEQEDVRKRRGFVYGSHSSEQGMIVLDEEHCYISKLEDYQKQGASKQAAAQLMAQERRDTIDRITRWYDEGWQWWGVECSFYVANKQYHDALWGIDDLDYADQVVIPEIVAQVVHVIEQDGWEVSGKPAQPKQKLIRYLSLAEWKQKFKRNINSFNMENRDKCRLPN